MKVGTSRVKRLLSEAANIAQESTWSKHRHGALLCRGKRIIQRGVNQGRFCSLGARFQDRKKTRSKIEEGSPLHTLHAEEAAVLGVARQITTGSSVYVARIGKRKEWRMSKPCPKCEAVLRFVGVKRVYYTTDDGYGVMYV